MEVIFSDNKTYIFTEYQLIRIPYFEVLINSSIWLENKSNKITINHNSIGFDFIHIFATMDEIDILDPGDNYLFVMKQCDYFCYDRLKILLDCKYGFRKIVPDINNNIGKEMITKFKYLGKYKLESRESYECVDDSDDMPLITRYFIIPIFEHEFYTNDDEMNEIYKNKYKSKMMNYYLDLIKKIYEEHATNTIIRQNYEISVPSLQTHDVNLLSDKYFYQIIKDEIIKDDILIKEFHIVVHEKL